MRISLAVVHHARKNGASAGQAGQSLRGASDQRAWGDSNLYLRRAQGALTAAPEPLALELAEGDGGGDTHLALVDHSGPGAGNSATDLDESIIAALTAARGPLGRGALRDQLRVRKERLGHALARLADRGAIVRIGERWGIPIPTPSSARERNAAA